ncbi:uncharacterized protein LOC120005476 [Tripterygium wilfordii]|uniref:uncharacterized protein LOC120005476 n=1 Tax=Tripterygium wilfordii TaxID=458696 RepID=UPI0018F855E2|nr:uncharacterized protein LOC120005476 [Tripterygium wilfordii]
MNLIYLFVYVFCLFFLELAAAIDTMKSSQFINDSETIISTGGSFELGFFSPVNTTNRYVGIWSKDKFRADVVWVANRDKPLKDLTGIVTMSADGNLVVLNGQKEIIWSSNVSNATNSSSAQLLETGNLVLRDNISGKNLWESFQNPSNTFLAGMEISTNSRTGKKVQLTSWKSPSDPSMGSFSCGIIHTRVNPEVFIWNNNRPYWRSGQWNGQVFIGVPSMYSFSSDGLDVVVDQDGTTSLHFKIFLASNSAYFVLASQGKLVERVRNQAADIWSSFVSECDIYGHCGPFGICNSQTFPMCSCLSGFEPKNSIEWKSGNWTSGCVRSQPLQCERINSGLQEGEEDDFLKLEFVKLPDFAQWSSNQENDCKQECLKNCSCAAYAFDSGIGCMSWSGNLIDIKQYIPNVDLQRNVENLYVRLAYSEIESERRKTMEVAIIVAGIVGTITIAICTYYSWRWMGKYRARKGKSKEMLFDTNDENMNRDQTNQFELQEVPLFLLQKLAVATNNFHIDNKLGQGGFGPVYKGKLLDGQEIAVKRLSRDSGQGLKEFMNEVVVISKLQHRNLVRLLGCCVEGEEKMLIYEYMPKNSLDTVLFSSSKQESLDWRKRFNIIDGIGRGLMYLHRDSRLKIIHRDLKASNILLDEELNPKISDFGMARIFKKNEDQVNTQRIVGTYGYISPEYAMGGHISEKSDVFSFGVLLLEIISGRKNTSFYQDEHSLSLLGFAWKLWNENNIATLVDPSIGDSQNEVEIVRCIHVGLLCVQEFVIDRPTMSKVLSMLHSEILDLPAPRQPAFTGGCIIRDTESSQNKWSVNTLTVTTADGRVFLETKFFKKVIYQEVLRFSSPVIIVFHYSPTVRTVRDKAEHFIRWMPSDDSWTKVNTDGALRADVNCATTGGVIRDSDGKWVNGFSVNIGSCSVQNEELWGFLLGFKKLENLTHLVLRIKQLLSRDWVVRVNHVYCEANYCADSLAKLGFDLPQDAWTLWNKRNIAVLVDPSIDDSHNEVEIVRCMHSSVANLIVLRLSSSSFLFRSSSFSSIEVMRDRPIRVGKSLISENKTFELGFFSPENSTLSYVGIWYHNIQPQTVVWVANRETPISDDSGVLTIGGDGNLVILSANEPLVWSSNASILQQLFGLLTEKPQFLMILGETPISYDSGVLTIGGDGNLVILSANEPLVWSSNASILFGLLTEKPQFQMILGETPISDDFGVLTIGGDENLVILSANEPIKTILSRCGTPTLPFTHGLGFVYPRHHGKVISAVNEVSYLSLEYNFLIHNPALLFLNIVKQSEITMNLMCLFVYVLCLFFLELAVAVDTITSSQFINNSETIISPGGSFELGFFSPDNTTDRYVGIWTNGKFHADVLWVANRNKPLKDFTGIVTMSADGKLVVLNGQREIIWSSNVSNPTNSSSAQLLDTGNLVLRDNISGLTLWESFHNPSNALLAEMKISTNSRTGKKVQLTSWKSPSDPSMGSFSCGVISTHVSAEIFVWHNSRPYWRSGPWNGQVFIGLPSMNSFYSDGFDVVDDPDGTTSFNFKFSPASNSSYFVLDSQGKVVQRHRNLAADIWSSFVSECDIYGYCGPFGICNSQDFPICSCLRGFKPKSGMEWESGNWSSGCVRSQPLQCERINSGLQEGKEDGFLKLEYVKVPDFAQWSSIPEIDCKQECLKNCSCAAYAFDSGIGCMSWSGDLIDIKQYILNVDLWRNYENVVVLYIRLAYSELEKKKNMEVVIIVAAIVGTITIAICTYYSWRWMAKYRARKGKSKEMLFDTKDENMIRDQTNQFELQEVPLFLLQELAAATNNFHVDNKLGQGGFGPVYRGKLLDGQEIAVKRLSRDSGQGLKEFMNEVVVISKLQHRNLVRLLGCCVEGEEKMLIYEYMPKNSLDTVLFSSSKQESLDWRKRFNIIDGIGRGLMYLHRDSRLKIIHRDMKASNILLDEELNPKISDFGMARIFKKNEDQVNTQRIVGTYGYISPEYAMGGHISEKSDVFSFGVLLLEIISGRKNSSFYHDEQSLSVLGFAWKLWNERNIAALVDPSIGHSRIELEIVRCIHVGLLCVQEFVIDRPTMSMVLSMLHSEILDLPAPRQPAFTGNCVVRGMESSQNKWSVNTLTVTTADGR